ncbi:MAG: prepilin-type N-terminal cleavage/methylation domain-containing protein [Candidatus Omnitrophica bacterium]|nr:prepilin-type N-terminal cleavage/methylation domain-containing protein [Candidatus Omnitrophota bacterium]
MRIGSKISHGSPVGMGDQGFSLAESLIAIIVLAVTFAAGMAFYFNANNIYFRNLHLRQATFVAETKMEEIKNAGCNNTLNETGTAVIIGNINGLRDVVRPGTCTATNDVSVRVYWLEQGETTYREVNLITSVGS